MREGQRVIGPLGHGIVTDSYGGPPLDDDVSVRVQFDGGQHVWCYGQALLDVDEGRRSHRRHPYRTALTVFLPGDYR